MRSVWTCFLSAAVVSSALLSGVSCRTSYSGSYFLPETRETFPELTDAHLKLEPIGSRDFVSDVRKELQFRLTNVGGSSLVIEEWYRSEERNITIYYQDWLPEMKEPDSRLWMVLKPYTPPKSVRAPLTLSPNVAAVVKVPLSFLNGLTVSEGHERRFFVRAELNLMSVRASTPVFAITLI